MIVLALGHRFPDLDTERQVLGERIELVDGKELDESDIAQVLPQASAILLGTQATLDEDTIDRLLSCKAIVRYGIGADNVDLTAATRRGVLVANVPDYCLDEVSDHAVALMLSVWRRLPAVQEAVRRGEWGAAQLKGVQRIRGRVMGLIGYGRIGRLVASKVRALGMKVMVADPYADWEQLKSEGHQPVELDELARSSNVVSLHCPLTTSTRHIVNRHFLSIMQPSAILINTSRGGLIDEGALLNALDEGRLGGAGLDVLEQEPPPADHPLLSQERVVVTPHVAWYSEDSVMDLRKRAAEEVGKVLAGQDPDSPLNPKVAKGRKT